MENKKSDLNSLLGKPKADIHKSLGVNKPTVEKLLGKKETIAAKSELPKLAEGVRSEPYIKQDLMIRERA